MSVEQRIRVLEALRSASPCSFRTLAHEAERLMGPDCSKEDMNKLLQEAIEDRMMVCSTSGTDERILISRPARIMDDLYYVPHVRRAVRLNFELGSCSDWMDVPEFYNMYMKNDLEGMRKALEDSLLEYARSFPDASMEVYQDLNHESVLIVCIYKLKKNPKQMVSSSWKSVWNLRFGKDRESCMLKGTVEHDVYHAENFEIRHQLNLDYTKECRARDGENFVKEIKDIIVECEDAHASRSESLLSNTYLELLQSLRRNLPINKQRFEWDVHCDPSRK